MLSKFRPIIYVYTSQNALENSNPPGIQTVSLIQTIGLHAIATWLPFGRMPTRMRKPIVTVSVNN